VSRFGSLEIGITAAVVVLFAAVMVLMGGPPAATEARAEVSSLSLPTQEPLAVALQSSGETAVLDLQLLTQRHGIAEADNVRWSLIRRTPRAAEVYGGGPVDWGKLRQMSVSDTILVPSNRPWSFNETFKDGPGYRVTNGILAAGHCALATVFRHAADSAGLPVKVNKRHKTAIPGFTLEESVNILWGRDDLVIFNDTRQDIFLVWSVTPERVTIAITNADGLTPLPNWMESTAAMVYGHPGPGGWGTLGDTTHVDYALFKARRFAERVDSWNGDMPVTVVVNPNVSTSSKIITRENYLHYMIAETRRQGQFVMLDVKTGDRQPMTIFNYLMDTYLAENVWLDWDIESTVGGVVSAAAINEAAEAYFTRRTQLGYETPGVFGFYVFSNKQIINPEQVVRQYDGGIVVPIFDGYGTAETKIKKTRMIASLFGVGPYGAMEFQTKHGTKYDKIGAQEYFNSFPDALIFASQ
jgi:hypothetical protein